MPFFAFDGKVLIGQRQSNGDAGVLRYVGLTDGFSFGAEVSKTEPREKDSGQRLLAASFIDDKKASLTIRLQEWTKQNVALALWGTAATISGGTVTAEQAPNPVAVGDIIRTKKPKISSTVLKDSTGSPKTLVLGTNYSVFNADLGSYQILDLTAGGPYVHPLKIDYSNAAVDYVPMFGTIPGNWWVRLEGVNRADSGKASLIEFYNVVLDPLKELATKQDSGLSVLELSGAPLYDATKAADAQLGQFGWIAMP